MRLLRSLSSRVSSNFKDVDPQPVVHLSHSNAQPSSLQKIQVASYLKRISCVASCICCLQHRCAIATSEKTGSIFSTASFQAPTGSSPGLLKGEQVSFLHPLLHALCSSPWPCWWSSTESLSSIFKFVLQWVHPNLTLYSSAGEMWSHRCQRGGGGIASFNLLVMLLDPDVKTCLSLAALLLSPSSAPYWFHGL